jgi:hypothetical protein
VTRGSDRIPEHKMHVRLQLNLLQENMKKCENFYLLPLCRNSISEDGSCHCSRRFFLEINKQKQTSKILNMGREMERKGEKTRERYNNSAVNTVVFRIRIHLIRSQIRIQHFWLNTDPDPIWIQSFDDQKLTKFKTEEN